MIHCVFVCVFFSFGHKTFTPSIIAICWCFKWISEIKRNHENGNSLKPAAIWLDFRSVNMLDQKVKKQYCRQNENKIESVSKVFFVYFKNAMDFHWFNSRFYLSQIAAGEGKRNISQENFQLILQLSFIIFCTSVRQENNSNKTNFSLFMSRRKKNQLTRWS